MSTERHVIKHTHDDGKELTTPITWCGAKGVGWLFNNTHHVALSVGGSVQPCRSCIRAIITELQKEL